MPRIRYWARICALKLHCERINFSEGSFETKKDAQVIRVRGAAAPRVVFNSNYLFFFNRF